MQSIRILIPTHITPETTSVNTLFFENLLPVLQKYANVHLIWFVYKPDKINKLKKISNNVIIDIHDYDNAIELLQKEKPDIIFASATRSFIDYALSSAAKSMKIPTFSMFWSDWYYTPTSSKIQHVTLNISRFFQSSAPTDTNQDQKQQMRRGRFFVAKYLFLARTQKALKMNPIQIIFNFFVLLKHNLFDTATDSRFATTLHLLEDEKLKDSLIESGFDKSTLLVTGNPIFDESLQKSFEQHPIVKGNSHKRILFAPSTLYEHGFWNKEQRDSSVTEIVSQINSASDKMSISIKIHPSTSILSEYTSIINKINSSIPVYQKGGIQEFLENIDIVVTFQSSTAEVYAVIAKKPIIICNFFHSDQDILVKKGLAIECTNSSNLLESIEKASNIPAYEKKHSEFINEFLYKADGRAAERISNAILKLINKN